MIDTVVSAPIVPRQRIRIIFGALILVMLLASLDQTIVSTALPTIVGEFGGLEHLSWIVTAYMLATTIVAPLYGKLGDLFGRKIVLQFAIILFLLGSVLCGFSRSMLELIGFRVLQGLGGGGLMVTAMAVIGDIVTPRERAKYQGVVGAVFGLATVLGPLIGGFFVEHLNWRWIFYVNIPLGVVAFAVIGFAFTAPTERKHPKIDIAGAALLAMMLIALILFTSLGGHTYAWGSPQILLMIIVAAVSLAGFLAVERKAPEPLLPLQLFNNSTFVLTCVVGFIVGAAMFGAVTYMPIFLQVVKGMSPSIAGMLLTPMMGGFVITSIASGQIISRIGRYRMFPISGTAIMALGLGLLSTLDMNSSPTTASIYMFVLGLGMGMVMQVMALAVQNAVEYKYLGVATSSTTLFRLSGGSVGVSLFGAIFAAGMTSGLATRFPNAADIPSVSAPGAIHALAPELRDIYLEVFTAALHPVFVSATVLAAIAFFLTLRLKDQPLRGPARSETIGEIFGIPRELTSIEELEIILTQAEHREKRWDLAHRLAKTLDVVLTPDQLWLLVKLCRVQGTILQPGALAEQFKMSSEHMSELVTRLTEVSLARLTSDGSLIATDAGQQEYERMVAAYRTHLSHFLERWSPEDHAEARAMLTAHARSLFDEGPATPPRGQTASESR